MLKGRRVIIDEHQHVERAIKKLKKKVQDSGVLIEAREREAYVTPTERRKVKKSAAKKRWQKYLRSQQLPKRLY